MHQPKVVSSPPRPVLSAATTAGRARIRLQRPPRWLRRLPGRNLRRGLAFTLALFALHETGNAGTLYLAKLNAANENPPTASTATGLGVVILNDAETVATVTATHNVGATLSGGHIHRAAVGVNGPILFPFPNPVSPVGPLTWNITPGAVASLKGQELYMNFHTTENPGGAIRGQLIRASLSAAATNVTQNKLANLVLDVSAGYDADLDQILIQTNLAPLATQTQALDDLSARTVYVPARQEIEAMASLATGLFGQAEEARLNPEKEAGGLRTFLRGGSDFGRRSASEHQAGASFSRPFAMAGMDRAFGGGGRGGLAVGYADGRDSFDAGAGRTKTRTTVLQAFASTKAGGSAVVLDATVGYGWGRIDTVRNLASIARSATASPDGTSWSAALKASLPVELSNQATVIPYARFDAQEAMVDAYAESGAGAADLLVPERKVHESSMEGGLSLILPMKVQTSTVTARLQAGWHYRFEDGADDFSSRLAGSPVAFDTRIDGLGRSSAHIEASVTATVASRSLATLGYRGELGLNGQTAHAIEARLIFRL